jgi:chromate transporter
MIVLILGGIAYALTNNVFPKGITGTHMMFGVPILLQLPVVAASVPGGPELFLSGLKAGLLTFGGAYTAIPFLQQDAVGPGGWMTNAQFLDAIALSGILPAPLVIFSTFVGYVGGGFMGAILITAGVFLPAFLFTIVGHSFLERVVENKSLHAFLDGVTAGVIGLITVVAIELFPTAVRGAEGYVIFGIALLVAFRWKSKFATPVVVLGAGLAALLFWLLR